MSWLVGPFWCWATFFAALAAKLGNSKRKRPKVCFLKLTLIDQQRCCVALMLSLWEKEEEAMQI